MTILHPLASLLVTIPRKYQLSKLTKEYREVGRKEILGFTLRLNLEDKVHSRNLLLNGVWEPVQTGVTLGMLQRDDVFLDIGANIGYYTVLAASRVGNNGRVYAFEPELLAYEILVDNLQANGLFYRTTTFQQALGNTDGETDLYLNYKNAGDHRTWMDKSEARERTKVPIRRLISQELINWGINRVKIDSQGSELKILSGLSEFLEGDRNLKMIVEFWPYGLTGANSDPKELLELLRNSFSISVIEHGFQRLADIEILDICDERGFVNLYVERQ